MNDIVYEEQKQLIKMWKDKYDEKKREIERLNNIITELEKWIDNEIKQQHHTMSWDMRDKLKELKGSDKEC
jgi:flagellin-specific chaperone FliS